MLIVWIAVAILILVLTSEAGLTLPLSNALLLNGLVCSRAAPCSRLLLPDIPGSLLLSKRILDRESIKVVDETWFLRRLLESNA